MMYRLDPSRRMDRPIGRLDASLSRAEQYQGYGGDTISSALAAAAVPYLGRSFKYHRPRSILSFANHDSNTLFQVDGSPNVRGDVTLLRDGMQVSAVNTFGGLSARQGADLGSLRSPAAGGFLLQGVSFEALVSALGAHVPHAHGLGQRGARRRAPRDAKALWILRRLVIGGGPSGLSAALEAAAAGAAWRWSMRDSVSAALDARQCAGILAEAACEAVSSSPRITVC